MRFPAMILVLLAGVFQPVLAEVPKAQEQADSQSEKTEEQKNMDVLAQAGIRQALEAVAKSGGLYPFGLFTVDGEVKAVGYSGDRDKAPSEEDWAKALFMKLRQIGEEQPDVEMLSLYRLHTITNDAGEKVVGVWAQVDHRAVRPWVIFLPFIKNAEGKHEVGEPIYYATEQPLFAPEKGEQE
ncbi:hypothetical protein [Alcanivorax sediminis]|uniref:Uncharacterized protein n=1 Tax=Alcanivorax sediminis TaxID=2663008 RepID=A0A6N7LYL6_9GAMM|nr:hypothetical protein [Alcanivorax sediminis]MQX54506.1 hypothetical protein [Alcanivorax sediminis]